MVLYSEVLERLFCGLDSFPWAQFEVLSDSNRFGSEINACQEAKRQTPHSFSQIRINTTLITALVKVMISRLKRTRKIAEESDSERTSGESTSAVESGPVLRIKVAEPERGSSSFFKRLLDRISVVFRRGTRRRGWGRRRGATVSGFEVETVPRRVARIRWPGVERVLEYALEEVPVGVERGVVQADSVSESGGKGSLHVEGAQEGDEVDLEAVGIWDPTEYYLVGGDVGDEAWAEMNLPQPETRRSRQEDAITRASSASRQRPNSTLNANWNEQNGGSDDPDDNDNNCLQLQSQLEETEQQLEFGPIRALPQNAYIS
ncbi:hypothetical protein B0H11DRAFT_1915289 [Mycena galericulata]|nr:hypothetical protein B0H11DRAFT_1915289 [Mycena galericulata]